MWVKEMEMTGCSPEVQTGENKFGRLEGEEGESEGGKFGKEMRTVTKPPTRPYPNQTWIHSIIGWL